MTAFNDACRALAAGECRATFPAACMSPVSTPPAVMSLKLAGFLDPAYQCKPFLAVTPQTSPQPSDALRDRDRIHGVIRGMAAGSMASPRSIVRPDGPLQSLSLARAVPSPRSPADITFVEAHGPGTQQGDPAGLVSICAVIVNRQPSNHLAIGSAKGNIGHSEAAAPSASSRPSLYPRVHPQTFFHSSLPNLQLSHFFNQHPIRISDSKQEWTAAHRIAVVSNFGATRYAGCMVTEASPLRAIAGPLSFMISAKDRPGRSPPSPSATPTG